MPPRRDSLMALLRLGVPMGLTILIEVTGFTFMAIFIARFGATPVAGHQIAVNLVSLMFMMPLAMANATAHAGGAEHRCRRTCTMRAGSAWHGLLVDDAHRPHAPARWCICCAKPSSACTPPTPQWSRRRCRCCAWVGLFHLCRCAADVRRSSCCAPTGRRWCRW